MGSNASRGSLKQAKRARIQALRAMGATLSSIAVREGCSISTVSRWCERRTVEDQKRTGRPTKLDPQDKQRVEELMADKWGSSLRTTARVLNHSTDFRAAGKTVSAWSIRRHLQTTAWGKVAYKGSVKPLLSAKNITDRLLFCTMVQRTGYCSHPASACELLSHVLFTDEAPITLHPLPNRQNYRIRTSNPALRILQQPKNSITIMVAGGMSAAGLTELHVVDYRSTVNGEYYRSRIVPIYQQSSRALDSGGLFARPHLVTLQQDGAPAHTADATMTLLRQSFPFVWGKGVWPGNSPDLNPVEHLWAILQESVFEEPRPSGRQALIERVQTAWSKIPFPLIQSLVFSFPKRIAECLDNEGGHTSY
jgi:transposase